jgi:predicted AlkP superfamily pyrophosphatase or phosphodiesterase
MRYVYPALVLLLGLAAFAAINIAERKPSRIENQQNAAERHAPPGTPKLVVLAVFDQMKEEYLEKWDHLFCEGGFKRLKSEGAWFANCHYPYSVTLTGPGHASIATGCSANAHGIVANEWYDRREGDVNCIDGPKGGRPSKGPYRRKQESFADALVNHRKNARVFSLSIKDRAAILLAALQTQVCIWLDPKKGNFVTSDFYAANLPRWVRDFNKDRAQGADRWLGKNWERFFADTSIYEKNAGPDNVLEEGAGYNQGRTFPHPFVADEKLGMESYSEATVCSPAAGELLLDLVMKAIDAEKIGQGNTTDILTLGFSNNDYVGHCWGPDSQEVLDVTLSSDFVVKRLLDALDAKVGKGNYVFAVTADHGVCPIPELAAKQGKAAGRVEPDLFNSKVQKFLDEKYGKKKGQKWIAPTTKNNSWIYLNHATIKERKLDPVQVENVLVEWLKKDARILAAYGKSQLTAGTLDELGERTKLSFHPGGVGDVMAVLKPYFIISGPPTTKKIEPYRTTHGSPHPYDTHVPFIVMGPGVAPGRHDERVAPQAMAATLSRLMNVPPPRGAAFAVPTTLFAK